MENILYILTISTPLLILPIVIGRALHWTYLWQLKEYRYDRFRDYALTASGKLFLFSWWRWVEVLLFICTIIFLVSAPETYIMIAYLAFLVLYLLYLGMRTISWNILPKWTMKTILITSISSVVFILLWLISISISPLYTSLLFIATPIIQTIIIFSIEPLIRYKKRLIMKSASQKLQQMSPTVIGITGSYGKSTTKEFLRTILAPHFYVLATENNVNVDIGVAQTILNSLEKKHDVFIVEMGAYRAGEIASSCRVASPHISIITAIANQHAALFGTVDDIREAKSEIIQALPEHGHAILNYDSPGTHGVEHKTKAPVTWYSTSDPTAVHANNIVMTPHNVQFTLHIGSKSVPVNAPLHGKQAIPSILAAASAAHHLGLSIDDIANGIARLSPISGTMNVKSGINGCTVIDDSYNSNPDGFIAALEYLMTFSDKRKIVVTNGMYELGDYAEEEHIRVGERIAEASDYLIIGKEDYAESLINGAVSQDMPDHLIWIGDIEQQLRTIDLSDNDVVLIQGRVPASVLNYVVHTKV